MKIYLAGAISDVTKEEATEWRDDIVEYLRENTYFTSECFNPCDYICDEMTNKEAMEYDLYKLCQSDLVICNWNANSIGTAIELGVAREHDIPILLLNEDNKVLHPWVELISAKIFYTKYDLLQYIIRHYYYYS